MAENKLLGEYIVFSDIQGSFSYLERFFEATKKMRKKGFICLGDIVDRFDEFSDNRCIEVIKENVEHCVKGNHEDKIFDDSKISPENLGYIRKLPEFKDLGNVLLFHSSLSEHNQRLIEETQIQRELEFISQNFPLTRFAFFGHTHKKGVYTLRDDKVCSLDKNKAKLNLEELNLINPGAIGVRYGLEKTFARINFDNGNLDFFLLEEAQDLAFKSDIIDTFDTRWMPVLNEDSYNWFLQYSKADIPIIEGKIRNDDNLFRVVSTLKSFDISTLERIGSSKKKKYLEMYSYNLAQAIKEIRYKINEFYQTKDPIESREEFLRLKRKKY